MRLFLLALCVWWCQASADEQSCQSPKLAQGFLVPELESYEHGAEVSYGCNPGWKSGVEAWWGVIKCENGKWSQAPQCIALSDCITPHVPHAKPVPLQESYSTNSKVAFTCNKGYEQTRTDFKESVCENGEWSTLPTCTRKRVACDAPSHVANAVITKPYRNTFDHSETVEYQCKKGYELVGLKYSLCRAREWSPAPRCVPSRRRPIPSKPSQAAVLQSDQAPVRNCDTYPAIKNGDVMEGPDGKVLTVECARFYTRSGPEHVRCVNGQWSELPVCKEPCKLDQSVSRYPLKKEYMQHGEEDRFYCSILTRVHVKCEDGVAYYRGCGRDEW